MSRPRRSRRQRVRGDGGGSTVSEPGLALQWPNLGTCSTAGRSPMLFNHPARLWLLGEVEPAPWAPKPCASHGPCAPREEQDSPPGSTVGVSPLPQPAGKARAEELILIRRQQRSSQKTHAHLLPAGVSAHRESHRSSPGIACHRRPDQGSPPPTQHHTKLHQGPQPLTGQARHYYRDIANHDDSKNTQRTRHLSARARASDSSTVRTPFRHRHETTTIHLVTQQGTNASRVTPSIRTQLYTPSRDESAQRSKARLRSSGTLQLTVREYLRSAVSTVGKASQKKKTNNKTKPNPD